MALDVITKLEADITAAKAEVASCEAQLAAAEARLVKLLTAREILVSYGEAEVDDDVTARRATLADRIEQALLTKGPATPAEILQRLSAIGVITTQAAISTTLSRMKAAQRVTNVSGRWQVVARLTPGAARSETVGGQ